MIGHHLRVTAFAAVLAIAAASSAFAAKFDGNWHMLVVTTRGHCGKIPVGLAIKGGDMHATGGSFVFHPIRLDGHVSSSGKTRLVGVAGPRIARGSGVFDHTYGRGIWNGTGPSGVCSGTWSAWRG